MRILHICQRDDPDIGGSLRVAEALVREQRAAGLDAWLLFLYGSLGPVAEAISPNVLTLGLHSSGESYSGIWKLLKTIRRIAPDIIHSHDGIIWPRISLLLTRIPVVTHTHLHFNNPQHPKEAIGNKLIKLTTDMLIGISLPTITTWATTYPPSMIHYVPNGVDYDRFHRLEDDEKQEMRRRLGLPEGKFLLLWVGRIHREMKGSDRVERISFSLPDDMVLVVVGSGPDSDGMKHRCARLLAAGKMVMVGAANDPENYYKAADGFLFTSYYEPFGLVLLEAVAACLPIIAFPVTGGGGAVRLLDEFGALMLDDDLSESGIRDVLCKMRIRRADALGRLELARRKYSWALASAEIIDSYKILANRTL